MDRRALVRVRDKCEVGWRKVSLDLPNGTIAYYIRGNLPFKNKNKRNSTAKKIIAVAKEANNVDIVVPSVLWAFPF